MNGVLAYDRARLDLLRAGLAQAADELHRVDTDDLAAADVMRALRAACRTLMDVHLAKVREVLASDVMTWYRSCGVASSTQHDRSWEAVSLGLYPLPRRLLSFDEVLGAATSKALVPLPAPLDANGRANEIYTSIAIAPNHPKLIGTTDITPGVMKLLDFLSDGLPLAFRDHRELEIWHFSDARVVSSVHRLTDYPAADRYPETLIDETEEAVVSGYLILDVKSSSLQANIPIGPKGGDPTLSFPIDLGSSTEYSGMFFPDSTPSFAPISREPRFVAEPKWTFTKSAGPMVEGWGTWGL